MADGITMRVLGIPRVLANLRKQRAKVRKGIGDGLKKAGLFLIRESMKVVPVDTGNLRASWFVGATGENENTVVAVGYSANYAVFVHENLDATHAPGRVAKFLEKPARLYGKQMVEIVRKEAGV